MTTHKDEDIVVAKVFTDIAAATTAKEKLEEAGIQSVVDDMNVVGLTPLAGVEVRVFQSDYARAVEILQD